MSRTLFQTILNHVRTLINLNNRFSDSLKKNEPRGKAGARHKAAEMVVQMDAAQGKHPLPSSLKELTG